MSPPPIIEMDNAIKTFRPSSLFGDRGGVDALRGVSLRLDAGAALALVGESGSGKSTIARAIAGLISLTSGKVLYRGADISAARGRAARLAYARSVQMIFQDPFSALNPSHTVRHHLSRPLQLHGRDQSDTESEIRRFLDAVELTPDETMNKYPHELSGGERQRVNLARALAVGAELIIADEPTSMLDVSIRRSVLELMQRLRRENGIAFLYITHDLATGTGFAEETAVMFAGRIVEQGPSAALIREPRHPYTKLLLSALPRVGQRLQSDSGSRKTFTATANTVRTATRESTQDLVEWRAGHFVRAAD